MISPFNCFIIQYHIIITLLCALKMDYHILILAIVIFVPAQDDGQIDINDRTTIIPPMCSLEITAYINLVVLCH